MHLLKFNRNGIGRGRRRGPRASARPARTRTHRTPIRRVCATFRWGGRALQYVAGREIHAQLVYGAPLGRRCSLGGDRYVSFEQTEHSLCTDGTYGTTKAPRDTTAAAATACPSLASNGLRCWQDDQDALLNGYDPAVGVAHMTNLNTRVRAKGALFTNYYLACTSLTSRVLVVATLYACLQGGS